MLGIHGENHCISVGGLDATSFLYLVILAGGMIGRKGWPEFVPADFSVPAQSLVRAEIRCFDDGAATIPPMYANVRGTLGGS